MTHTRLPHTAHRSSGPPIRCRQARYTALCAALLLAAATAWSQSGGGGQRGQHGQRGLDEDRPKVQGAAAGPKKPKIKPPRALSVFEWTPAADPQSNPAGGSAQTASAPAGIGSDAPPSLQQARAGQNLGPASPVMLVPTPQQGAPSLEATNKPASARLVPVSVFYEGKYQDGGVYLAEPSPLAVSAPAVYAVEHAGDPLGFFTVHDSTREQGGWLGFGQWTPLQPGQTAASLFPDSKTDSDVLSGKVDPSLDSRDDNDKPTLRKHRAPVKGRKEVPAQQVSVPDPSGDPDRPRLKHKNPDEVGDLADLIGNPPGVRQSASISDASVIDERSFEHKFDTAADALQVQARMQQLARSLLRPGVLQVAQKKPPPHSNIRRAIPPATLFSNSQFGAYELAYQDEPTYVFAAQAGPAGAQQYVAVIAVPDVYGNLQVAWSSVTSTAQLGITPRYRLVDAVDADGDGRAEILMEARNQDGRRFVLFELYRGVATQVFQTEIIP